LSGHSKWAQIKRKKGITDLKRGQTFTKVGREIAIAARQGGGDPESNFRLRLAIQKAREVNMPHDNIERAIKRGTGGIGGAAYEEVIYEGYGPSGVAIMVQVMTDNRNRTTADLRNIFSRNGGNLGESGCVSWLFEQKGVIIVSADGSDTEELALQAIDAGAEDVKIDGRTLEVYTEPGALEDVKVKLEAQNVQISSAEVTMMPKSTVPLDEKAAVQTVRLMDLLEEHDDVQQVYANFDIPEEIMEKAESA